MLNVAHCCVAEEGSVQIFSMLHGKWIIIKGYTDSMLSGGYIWSIVVWPPLVGPVSTSYKLSDPNHVKDTNCFL